MDKQESQISSSEQQMVLPRLECLRCGHRWIPRKEKAPISCARRSCNSEYWNRPRTMKRYIDLACKRNANVKVGGLSG